MYFLNKIFGKLIFEAIDVKIFTCLRYFQNLLFSNFSITQTLTDGKRLCNC